MPKIYRGGELLANRYQIKSFLNEGGMQEVYVALDTVFHREVVVKVPKNDSAVKRFKSTAVLSARVTHPNIAKTLDYFEEATVAHLVEEYLPGGNLYDALISQVEALDPHLVARLLNHLSRGLAAAHHVDVVHRDLKPSNIILNGDLVDFTPKITDFGVAKMAQDEIEQAVKGGESSMAASRTAVGHLPYMAPELIKPPIKVRKPSDIWAIGALIFEMLSGTKPYGEGLIAVSAIVEAAPLKKPRAITRSRDYSNLGDEIFDIIQRCMQKDENARPTADELVNLTSKLCYSSAPIKCGVIIRRNGNTGVIEGDDGVRAFFHSSCVYGTQPRADDHVMYSTFEGQPLDRAQPILRARRPVG